MKQFLSALALVVVGFLPIASADEPKPKPAPAEGVKKPEGVKPAVKPEGDKPGIKKPAARTTGRIGKVNVEARTIVLVRKGDGGLREDEYTIAADAAITIDGKPAKLDALKSEMSVEAVAAGEGKALSEIRASGQKLYGILKSATADSVTVGGKEGKPADRTIKLAPGAKVLIQGKEGKLTDLPSGSRVFVQLTADDSAALLVTDGANAGGDKPKPGIKKPEGDKPGVKKPEGDKPGVKKPESDK